MTLGPLMIDIEGTILSPGDQKLLRHPLIGGVILFTSNYHHPDQLSALTGDIHDLRSPPLLIAVDQEGGRVQRFREHFTGLPTMRLLGCRSDMDLQESKDLAAACGWLMAAELRSCGLDLSFAPVLDLDWGLSEVIGDRSFHREPSRVAELGGQYIKGMKRAGMAPVGKHWPGHGAVSEDSHLALPRDRREYGDILADIAPFQKLIGAGLAGIMTAHIVYTDLDLTPASFSRFWIADELRGKLRFHGVIFSDDLSMQGAAGVGNLAERVRIALDAGADMTLICNDRDGVMQVIDELGAHNNPVSALRLTRLHGTGGMAREELMASDEWIATVKVISDMQHQPGLNLDA